MTLLSVVKDVCASVGIAIPASIFSGLAGDRTKQEMLSLANEMAQRIAYDTREWTKLKKTAVLNGDGTKVAFDLPANYKRMTLRGDVWRSTSALQPMQFIPDTNEWIQRRANNWYSSWGEWTMLGGQMLIQPVMGSGVTATFIYMDKNCVQLAGGGTGDSFLTDNDGFVLDERLLKLGMLWQWKAQKGSPYAEDMGTWVDALGQAQGADQPAPILVGRLPISSWTRTSTAYPWPVPT
jgi:hypothetical protein